MKQFLAPVLAVVAFVSVFACSSAQKQAAKDLGLDTGVCAAKCAVENLSRSADQMLSTCAAKCGEELLTDPSKRQNVIDIFAGAQAGATKAGAKLDAGAPQ